MCCILAHYPTSLESSNNYLILSVPLVHRLKVLAVILRVIVLAGVLKLVLPFIRSRGIYKSLWMLLLPVRMMTGL